MAGERTEQASPQRRDKARRDGDLLHSRELSSAAGTLAGVVLLGMIGPRFVTLWTASLSGFLALGATADWEPGRVDATLRSLMTLAMSVLSPAGIVGIAVAGASLGAGMLQTGGIQLHPQVIGVKLDRINPLSNIKNLFSLRSAARLGKSMIPAAFLAVFAVQRLAKQWDIPPFSSARLMGLGREIYQLLLVAAWLLFAWALIDYMVEWRSREQRLKMSRQEMREEYKESEGNPQIRGRIRNLRRQARRRRLQADVSKAAVIVTNPTHYAVALDFDFETMEAPKVLAKGRNLLAEEIKEQARWAGVPILENPPLARSLYRFVEPGEAIPVDLYAAVASILAFLYRQRVEEEMRQRRVKAASERPANQPSRGDKHDSGGGRAGSGPGSPSTGQSGTTGAVIPGTGLRRVRMARNPVTGSTVPGLNGKQGTQPEFSSESPDERGKP